LFALARGRERKGKIMHEFNINYMVKVKLTDYGRDIYYHQYDALNSKCNRIINEPRFPKTDENGYTSFQLWNLMELYGPYMKLAASLPFETNIFIEDKAVNKDE
jgi:hypothetical protein